MKNFRIPKMHWTLWLALAGIVIWIMIRIAIAITNAIQDMVSGLNRLLQGSAFFTNLFCLGIVAVIVAFLWNQYGPGKKKTDSAGDNGKTVANRHSH